MNVGNYKILTDEGVLLEKGLLKKAATIKIFEYSALGSDLKKQTSIARKQYQQVHKVHRLKYN